jgi:hypothetical protein
LVLLFGRRYPDHTAMARPPQPNRLISLFALRSVQTQRC